MTNLAKPVSRIVEKSSAAVPHQGGRHEQRERVLLPRHIPAVLGRVEDEEVASESAATLLISASTPSDVQSVARRIHGVSIRAEAPFVLVRPCVFPIEQGALRDHCSALLDAAMGGSLLMMDVEELPRTVQEVLLDVLTELQSDNASPAAVRLIAGTTVSLVDRVAVGSFSERLFYRLNVLHVVTGTDPVSSSIRV